jgi:hypothetical protein
MLAFKGTEVVTTSVEAGRHEPVKGPDGGPLFLRTRIVVRGVVRDALRFGGTKLPRAASPRASRSSS